MAIPTSTPITILPSINCTGWVSTSGIWYATYSVPSAIPGTPYRLAVVKSLAATSLRNLDYIKPTPYTYKSGNTYQVVTNLCNYLNRHNQDSASFSVNMVEWSEGMEYNHTKGTTSSIFDTYSMGVGGGIPSNPTDNNLKFPGITNSNYYAYVSPPTNITTQKLLRYSANSKFGTTTAPNGLVGENTEGIVGFNINEMTYQIQGYAFYKYASQPYTPYRPDINQKMFQNGLGWNYNPDFNGNELLHWYDHSSSGYYPVGPCSVLPGGKNSKIAAFGYKQNNFIAKFIPFSYFNFSFNYQNEGNFPLEIYMSNTLPGSNPGSFSRPNGSQDLATLTYSVVGGFGSDLYSVPHSFYSIQGGRYLIIKGPAIDPRPTGFTYSNIFITNLKIEGGYHPGNNRQYLMTNSNQYSGNTTLTPIGLTGATYSTLVGFGNTINATSSLSVSEINANVGNGLFKAGVWENGVWNSGWRYDDGVYEFNNVFQYFNYNRAKRWRIQLEGALESVSKFTIGDRIAIGNIIAIDINEERKVLKNYFTIINKTSTSIIVEFDNDFPLRRIEKDSINHRIYVTKNVWLAGAFFNGYFKGVWNYGLFKGYPLITEMYDTHWIDGIFDGGHFSTSYYTVPKFVDTYFYPQKFGGKVGLTFSSPHGLIIGDIINIQKDNINVNPQYNGETTIERVINKYHVVTDLDWGQDTTLEGGTVSVTTSKGLIQKMDFKSNNLSRTTSNQSMESPSVFSYNSWIDVNYYDTSAVNIGKPITLLNELSGLEYSQNNLFGHPTDDVLQSRSLFRNSYNLRSVYYNLGVKYKIFDDYIGKSGEFEQKFGPTGRGAQIFKNLGWTVSKYSDNSLTFSRTEDIGDEEVIGQELQIETTGYGGILDIYPLPNDTIFGRTNETINSNRYTAIEFDLVTFSATSQFLDTSIPSVSSSVKSGLFPKGSDKGIMAVPQIHFNNLNKVTKNVFYGTSVGTVSTFYDATFLPNYKNVNHIVTSKKRKVEYFFNKRNLSMHFLGNSLYFDSTTALFIIDNLKFYETDMIPFFKYFEENNINKGVQIPYQGVSPFIDYTNSEFNFIDNISIGVDSISVVSSTSPLGGIAAGVAVGPAVTPPIFTNPLLDTRQEFNNTILGGG